MAIFDGKSQVDTFEDDSDLFEEVSLSATALIQGNCSNATYDPNPEGLAGEAPLDRKFTG